MPSSASGNQTCALRSEEHTSELKSHDNLVCRLLLEKRDFVLRAVRDTGGMQCPLGKTFRRREGPDGKKQISVERTVRLVLFFIRRRVPPDIAKFPAETLSG